MPNSLYKKSISLSPLTPHLPPTGLESKAVTQVACHAGGRHYLCRSACGGAWSWGAGDDGRLGHGDTAARDAPQPLHHLAHHEVVRVAAGHACRSKMFHLKNCL